MSKGLMLRPVCPRDGSHGEMHLREPVSKEQAWCGTWYTCGRCASSVLLMSPELRAMYPPHPAGEPTPADEALPPTGQTDEF